MMCIPGNPGTSLKTERNFTSYTAKQIQSIMYVSKQTITSPQVRGSDSTICHSRFILDSPGKQGG